MNQYHKYIKVASIGTIALGLMVITGWVIGIEVLKSFIDGLPTMKFNTALCFILSGISLLLLIENKKKFRYTQLAILTFVLLVGTINFTQDIFSYNSGIDEWLVKDIMASSSGETNPGRMATSTSLSFMLLSLAFMGIALGKKNILTVIQFTLHLVTLIAFIATVGYLYNIPSFYKLSFLSSMAINTASLFFVLSGAASLLNHTLGITGLFTGKRIGSVMAREIFPLIVVMVIVLGFLRLLLAWNNMVTEDFGIALYAISSLLFALVIISKTAKHLNTSDEKRSAAEESLTAMNKHLEELVNARTKRIQDISERLMLATKGSKIGIWDWDIITDTMTWDDRMLELYGINSLQFNGSYEAWESRLYPEDKITAKTAIQKAIAGENELDIEFRVVWPDKSVHYIKGNALLQRDNTGTALRMVGTNWDITAKVELLQKKEKIKQEQHNAILKTAIEIQENERSELSWELLENINQYLASAKMKLAQIGILKEIDVPETINESQQLVNKAIAGIKSLTSNIETSTIEDLGLIPALENIIHEATRTTQCKIEFHHELNEQALEPSTTLSIFRIIQDQLMNIIKHSGASQVSISLQVKEGNFIVDITDNGKEFEEYEIINNKYLTNIFNRTSSNNGKVIFKNIHNGGFKVNVEIPQKK